MRRSLFTDFEHAAAFMDEANLAVAAHRRKLWGRFFSAAQLAVPRANPIDIWFDSAVPTPSQLSVRATAGFPVSDPASDVKLNFFLDVDSRRDSPQFSLPAMLIDAKQWPVVQKPNAGTIVKTLQTLLVKAELSVGASGIDGKFGNATVSAVETFSSTRGLPIGESVDADVWPVLVTPLRRGANEAAVGAVQQHFIDRGVPLTRDNNFGPRTQIAVMDLQSDFDLPANGELDTQTWLALVGS